MRTYARLAALLCCLTSQAAAQVRDTATVGPPFDQAAALAELKKFIAGKEEQPAVDIFNNIQVYTGVTAGRFLRIMEFGFNTALGVDCTHCHKPGFWDSDDKPTKQIARDMTNMLNAINNEVPEEDSEPAQHEPAGELHDLPSRTTTAGAGAA
jgi:hypothetical protein